MGVALYLWGKNAFCHSTRKPTTRAHPSYLLYTGNINLLLPYAFTTSPAPPVRASKFQVLSLKIQPFSSLSGFWPS